MLHLRRAVYTLNGQGFAVRGSGDAVDEHLHRLRQWGGEVEITEDGIEDGPGLYDEKGNEVVEIMRYAGANEPVVNAGDESPLLPPSTVPAPTANAAGGYGLTAAGGGPAEPPSWSPPSWGYHDGWARGMAEMPTVGVDEGPLLPPSSLPGDGRAAGPTTNAGTGRTGEEWPLPLPSTL